MGGILDGVRVLDMTSVIFGPYCTATLASMGAEVTKVEPARGDEARRVGRPRTTRGMGPLHLTLNAGKASVVIDPRSEAGRQELQRLVSECDVLIHNLRPDALARAGLDWQTLRQSRPDLVHVSCTGFASDGPMAGRAAYDDVVQAASGAATLLPRVDGNPAPRYLPMAMADKVAGLHATYAVLGALYHRERTGEGQAVEVPMFESFAHFLLQDHLFGGALEPPLEPMGYPRQLDPERQPIATADGWIAIAPYTDARWVRFFEATGEGHVLADNGLTDARTRFAGLDLMQRELARIAKGRTTRDWLVFCAENDIPAAGIRDLADLPNDPQLVATGFFRRRQHPTEGGWIDLAAPVRFGAAPEVERAPARTLGQDTPDP